MRRRKEISVELTPLLDVILIMLFLIISGNTKAAEEAKSQAQQEISRMQEAADEISQQNETLSDELKTAENALYGYKTFDEYSLILSVGIENSSDNRTILITDGTTSQTVVYDWDNMRYGENALRAVLNDYISTAEDIPAFITFTFSSDKIYRQDYELITSVIDETAQEDKDIYVKYKERNE